MPRHSVPCGLLARLLAALLAGASLKAAAEALGSPFAPETFYRLRGKLRRRLDAVRACLCRERAAPASRRPDPLDQTIEHLHAIFPAAAAAPAGFQLRFGRAFLG